MSDTDGNYTVEDFVGLSVIWYPPIDGSIHSESYYDVDRGFHYGKVNVSQIVCFALDNKFAIATNLLPEGATILSIYKNTNFYVEDGQPFSYIRNHLVADYMDCLHTQVTLDAFKACVNSLL